MFSSCTCKTGHEKWNRMNTFTIKRETMAEQLASFPLRANQVRSCTIAAARWALALSLQARCAHGSPSTGRLAAHKRSLLYTNAWHAKGRRVFVVQVERRRWMSTTVVTAGADSAAGEYPASQQLPSEAEARAQTYEGRGGARLDVIRAVASLSSYRTILPASSLAYLALQVCLCRRTDLRPGPLQLQ